MRLLLLLISAFCLTITSCKKTADRPKSKTDFIPIISSQTPRDVSLGQEIKSRVTMGFYSYNADVTFLNFEVKEKSAKQFEIRAKGFYDNINYEFSLPVVMTFDSTVFIRPVATGEYLLKFYTGSQLVQTDTVHVN